MTELDKLCKAIETQPKPGTILLRSKFNKWYNRIGDINTCAGKWDDHKREFVYIPEEKRDLRELGNQYVGMSWSVSVNYQCLDTYSDTQRVKVLGFVITAWHPLRCNHSMSMTYRGTSSTSFLRKLRKLASDLLASCYHPHDKIRQLSGEECRARNILHFGMCYHVYECECGAVWAEDSSG